MRFSLKRQDESAPNFLKGLGENTCLLQHIRILMCYRVWISTVRWL